MDSLLEILNSKDDNDVLLGLEMVKHMSEYERSEIRKLIPYITAEEWMQEPAYRGWWIKDKQNKIHRYFLPPGADNWLIKYL